MLVRSKQLNECSNELERFTYKLRQAQETLRVVGNVLSEYDDEQYEELRYIINSEAASIGQSIGKIHTLASTLECISSQYKRSENNVVNAVERSNRPKRIIGFSRPTDLSFIDNITRILGK